MRHKTAFIVTILVCVVALLVGCAPKIKGPEVKKAPAVGPIAGLQVRVLGEDEAGEWGMTSLQGKRIGNVGGFLMFGPQGEDASGNKFWVDATWRAEPEGYVEITPTTGSKVKVTGLKLREESIKIIAEYNELQATGYVEGIGEY